jgi:hypothetical protein
MRPAAARRALTDPRCALLLLGAFVLGACAAKGSTPPPQAQAGRWVAVLAPKDIPPDTYPPIEKTRRVQTFETFADCENYRNQALADAAAMASSAMLEEASSLRCIPDRAGSTAAPAK